MRSSILFKPQNFICISHTFFHSFYTKKKSFIDDNVAEIINGYNFYLCPDIITFFKKFKLENY